MAIDTACSSSLVAVHLACQSLRQKECDAALAGGVNLNLSPENTIALSKARMLSSDGRCKTFDADADGIVRGEGCGVIVLKRLSDAVAAGDPIQAVIRGSAVNQDGPSSGFTVPNSLAQQELLRSALESANLSGTDVDYVEAHGTGTPLGDPIEVRALGLVLGKGRPQDRPLYIGSVKTNLGHLESAAGIAGLIKVVLSLHYEAIPPHLHFRQPNPHVDWDRIPVKVTAAGQVWQRSDKPRVAGVSSFGASGTNAHVLVAEAPIPKRVSEQMNAPVEELPDSSMHLLPLSADSEAALQDLIQSYRTYFAQETEVSFADVCYTCQTGRRHFPYRLAIIAESARDAEQQLAQFQSSTKKQATQAVYGKASVGFKSCKVAFLFTGQGAQYPGMGRDLYECNPAFRSTLEQCDRLLRPHLETPLLEVLYGSATDLLNQTAYTQPALFAVEYALAQVWQSWGVQPTAVLGHSLGEYVAACVAGVFSLEAGLKLVAERGRLMQNLPATGGMLAVLAPWEQIQPYWEKAPDALTIAAFNGPSNFVFSGTTSAIDAFAELLEAADIKAKPLLVSHGFHSPLMTPMVEAFRETLATIDYQTPEVPVISNVSGEAIGTEIATADYWCQHILEPVRFAEGMQTLAEMKLSALLEVGPHPVLLGMGRSCMAEDNAAVLGWLPSLRRGQPDWTAMVSAAAELHIKGLSLNWSAVSGGSRRRVELPTYPFQRQRYWVEATSDGSQTEDNGTDNLEPVLQLVQQANLDRLSQQLVESMTLSSHQLQLLPDLLQQLVKLQQQSSLQEDMQGACYRLQWSEQATTFTESQQQQPQNWLILADRQGIGEVIAAHIESQGDCCTLAYAGTGKSLPTGDDTSLVLDPQDTEAFKKLLQDIGAVQRIVYCWGLDIPDTDVLTSPALAQSQAMGCGGLLHMLQAILHSSVTTNPKLCLLTRGAIAVDRTAPQIAQAPLWGLGRVIGLEYPEIWEGCIDLDPAVNTAPLSLSKLLKQPHRDQQLALRDGRLLAARLCKLPLSKESSQILPLSRQATYLITGGLGALGLHIAQGLIDAGVNSLVLLGRSQPSDIAQQQIEQWQQNNIQIQVTQADVADLNQLQAIVQKANQESSPLRGIVHAAGILDDGILLNQQWSQFEKVLRPKVAGAWNLHTLTRDLDLDFFVGFSSAVAILGAPGQGNYAAANLFLNALMEYRQTLGLPGLSLNWGPWQQGGMAAALSNRFAAQGIQSLSASDGVKIFLRLLSSKHSHALVLPIDWSVFQGAATERYPMRLWADLRPDVPANREDVNADTETLIHELANLPPHQQALRLNATVKAEVAQVLGLKSLDSLEMDKGFADMGMDSLMAVELKSRLETSIGLPLQSTVVFNYPNMEALGAYLSEQLSAYLNERVRQADSETSTVLSTDPYEDLADLEKIKQLSEQDVVSLIAREFAQLC